MRMFDKKFGADFVSGLPTSAAVYLFKDAKGTTLYVGKAKNIRRRLGDYRNASRRRVHRKMRKIVSSSASVEVRLQPSEQEALVVENALIQQLTPPLNVAGKFSFLYPAFGIEWRDAHVLLCFTTDVSAWPDVGFGWFGTFSSRLRAKEAFDALVELLGLVGHLEPTRSLPTKPEVKGTRLVGVRQLSEELYHGVLDFFGGQSRTLLSHLAILLLEKPRARRESAHVQELLTCLSDFYESDLEPLRRALENAGRAQTFVSQEERDALFIRFGESST